MTLLYWKLRLTWSVSKVLAFNALYTHNASVVKSSLFIYSEKVALCSGTIQNTQKQTVGRKYDFFQCSTLRRMKCSLDFIVKWTIFMWLWTCTSGDYMVRLLGSLKRRGTSWLVERLASHEEFCAVKLDVGLNFSRKRWWKLCPVRKLYYVQVCLADILALWRLQKLLAVIANERL
jgi:hypothetical protein